MGEIDRRKPAARGGRVLNQRMLALFVVVLTAMVVGAEGVVIWVVAILWTVVIVLALGLALMAAFTRPR